MLARAKPLRLASLLCIPEIISSNCDAGMLALVHKKINKE